MLAAHGARGRGALLEPSQDPGAPSSSAGLASPLPREESEAQRGEPSRAGEDGWGPQGAEPRAATPASCPRGAQVHTTSFWSTAPWVLRNW